MNLEQIIYKQGTPEWDAVVNKITPIHLVRRGLSTDRETFLADAEVQRRGRLENMDGLRR